jgi:hypothetical protein
MLNVGGERLDKQQGRRLVVQFSWQKTHRLILASSNLIILLTVFSQSISAGYAATTLGPGTLPGDIVFYSVSSRDTGLHDPLVARFANVSAIDMTTLSVLGSEVTVSQTWRFTNGTDSRTFTLTGNVATGQGNYSSNSVQWFIAGGLKAGDPLYFSFGTVKVNSTIPNISYAGKTVTVNTWNVTAIGKGYSESDSHVWEQHSGLLMERNYHVSYQGLDAFLDIKGVQVNVQYPDFKLSVNQSTVNATTNSDAGSTIRLESLNGFIGTVGLSADPAAGLFCTLNPMILIVRTNASSILTCHASIAKSYTATVNATSGTIFHSVAITYQYTGPTTPTTQANVGLAPVLLYAFVSVAAGAGIVGFILLRRRGTSKTQIPVTGKASKDSARSG